MAVTVDLEFELRVEDYPSLRPDILAAIARYVREGTAVGDFLQAVIANNLREAIGRADEDNQRTLQEIVRLFYQDCPGACWGDKEAYVIWCAHRGLRDFQAYIDAQE